MSEDTLMTDHIKKIASGIDVPELTADQKSKLDQAVSELISVEAEDD